MKRDAATELARRHEVLLARSTRLRDELADEVRAVGRRLGGVERGVSIVRSGWFAPLVVAGGAALLVAGPSRWVRIAGRVLAVWPVIRPLVPRLAALLRATAPPPRRDSPSAPRPAARD
jgi:hypothetical protein